MQEVDKEAKEEGDREFRAKKTKNNNDMKKTNKEKKSNTSGNNFSTMKHHLTTPF